MKKLVVFFAVLALLTGNGAAVFADSTDSIALTQKKIMVYIKPDVLVQLNGVEMLFRNAQGQTVYPIIYNGSAYLPVRASSALMKEPIEWDKASKTVFIGKTLSSPNKEKGTIATAAAVVASDSAITSKPSARMESAYLKPDLLVMYDFQIQTFQDVNGDIVYPIVYNGSTYLPIRAISNLMKEPVEWDGKTKTISIGCCEEEAIYNEIEEEEKEEVIVTPEAISAYAKELKSLFDREEVLYYEATGKASTISQVASLEEKQLIASSITGNCEKVKELTLEIKAMDQSGIGDEERAAFDKLVEYAESTEYYMLVLENIAYMAAQGSDYSGLAETFLYFAMDSQTKMEEARNAILALN